MNATSTAGRLIRYMLLFRGRVTAALLVLALGMAAQLAGPLIAKTIIDDHILAIEQPWHELASEAVPSGVKHVDYRGMAYVREDWKGDSELSGAALAKVKQTGASFTLTSPSYGETILAADEVAEFYRHDVGPVMKLIGLIVALALMASVLNFVQSFMLQSTAQRVVQRIRMDVFRHIHRLPVRYFDNTPVGQIVSRIANDTESIKELYMSFMATFVVSGLNIIGVFTALLFLDWRMALVCAILLPLYAGIMVLHLKYSRKYVSIIRARLAEMNANLNEAIGAMPIIQAFRREQALVEEFDTLNSDRYRNQVLQFRIFGFSGRNAVYFFGRVFTAMIIWYFGIQSLSAAISFGVFYAFIDYLGRIFEPIIGIFDQLMNAQRAVVSAERVFAMMDEEGMEAEPRASSVGKRPEGVVAFDNVTFGYKPGEHVLHGVSFEAKRGETVALVGHTGSGKSSIMNLLLGFYEPTEGRITIDGQDIRSLSKQALRKHMGIVLQDPFLFTGDIRFNVGLHQAVGKQGVLADVLDTESGPGQRGDHASSTNASMPNPSAPASSSAIQGGSPTLSTSPILEGEPALSHSSVLRGGGERGQMQDRVPEQEREGLTDERLWHALREVGAADFVSALPGGLDEPVVERGGTLSAGQRQLISFARALAYDPAVLILDEATSSIDSETESLIQRALDVLRSGRTTFVIAHRLSTIKDADCILVLHRGRIVERGTHEELMALQGRYYRMYQLQASTVAAG